MSQRRSQQLEQSRERDVAFGLEARGPQHPHLAEGRERVLEQSGLPDARLAHEHEGAADPQPRRRDQSADGLAL